MEGFSMLKEITPQILNEGRVKLMDEFYMIYGSTLGFKVKASLLGMAYYSTLYMVTFSDKTMYLDGLRLFLDQLKVKVGDYICIIYNGQKAFELVFWDYRGMCLPIPPDAEVAGKSKKKITPQTIPRREIIINTKIIC